MAHLVTRYNEYTNDLDVIAIATSGATAHKLIAKDIERKGKELFKKQKGHSDYKLTITAHYVNLDNVLTYTITKVTEDELTEIKNF